jgi:hypothetical protein
MRGGQKWTKEEDDLLRHLIGQFGKQWSIIASYIPNRSASQAAARWEKCINPNLTKGSFTQEEDQVLVRFVEENGKRAWPKVTALLPGRTPKQCRERWFNNLDPTVTKDPWTPEEDRRIFDGYVTHGPKWSRIANELPGRTDNAIKNRWNASISRRMGIADSGEHVLGPNKVRKYSRRPKGTVSVVVSQAEIRASPRMCDSDEMRMSLAIDPMDVRIESSDLTELSFDDPVQDGVGGREIQPLFAPFEDPIMGSEQL